MGELLGRFVGAYCNTPQQNAPTKNLPKAKGSKQVIKLFFLKKINSY